MDVGAPDGRTSARVICCWSPGVLGVGLAAKVIESEAVQLFLDRACLASPGFALMPANAEAVAQVCIRLDGIPLALELAAASLRALPISQIATRIDQRFKLLTSGNRTALPRQQTPESAH